MNTFNRIKPRQTGKTTDIVDLAKTLSEIGRNIVVVVYSNNEIRKIQSKMKQIGNIRIISSKMFDSQTRGARHDTIIIDDYSRFDKEAQQSIAQYSIIYNAFIYTTDT